MGYVDETKWRADPWDDPDVTDALLVERVRRQHRSVKWFVWLLMYLGMAGIVVAGGVGLWYSEKVNPKGDPGAPVNFTVNDDDTVETIRLQRSCHTAS